MCVLDCSYKKGEPISVNQFSNYLTASGLFVTQTYNSSDFLSGISDIKTKNVPRNKKLFLGIICDPNIQ
jgi:hypothetical protein